MTSNDVVQCVSAAAAICQHHTAHPTLARRVFGILLSIVALVGTGVVAYKAHIATAELSEKVQITDAMFDSSNCSTAVVGADHTNVQWSHGMELLTGISGKDAFGKKNLIADFITEPDKKEEYVKARNSDSADKDNLIVLNTIINTPVRQDIPVQISIRKLKLNTGKLYTLVRIDKQASITEFGAPPPLPMRAIGDRSTEAAKAAE